MDFEFNTADKKPESSAKLVGSGKGVGSLVNIQTSFALEDSGSGTRVGWAADVVISGVMAGLGSKLLESTSSKMVTQVIENLKTKLDARSKA